MKIFIPVLLFSLLFPATWAIQPGAAPAQSAPLRDLEFGDINFLHTTDTHGWHAGHLLEPSFSADWGDYISFSEHLRNSLEADGKDLLIIDTGDRIEGNGLYDSSAPRGLYTFPIFEQQQMDLISVGNHELYKNSSSEDEYIKLVPHYKTHYLASNLCIIDPQTGNLVQLSSPYRVFTTKKRGIRILAFGFIFDFSNNDKNTHIQLVEDTIRMPWFTQALVENEVDLIVVIGHVALRSYEFEHIHEAIRKIKPDTPIQFFGGHYHVRDYRIFDQKAHALASGRFMETIGFQSITGVKSSSPKFFRSYIDNNLFSLYHHSRTDSSSFVTKQGRITTKAITRARNILQLDETFGCVDKTYWMARVPYSHNDSIYRLLTDSILPDFLNLNPERHNKSRLLVTNTGAIRFDIFAGPFTRDSTFIVSPFTSNLSYIPDVPYKLAKQLLPILNNGDPVAIDYLAMATYNQKHKFSLNALPPPEQAERNDIRHRFPQYRFEQDPRMSLAGHASHNDGSEFYESEARDDDYLNKYIGPRAVQEPLHEDKMTTNINTPDLTPGYTTIDDLGTTGDDTIHSPIPFYQIPNVIQSLIPSPNSSIPPNHNYPIPLDQHGHSRTSAPSDSADTELIDVVFNHFLAPYVIHILNILPYILDVAEDKPDSQKISMTAYEPVREAMYWIYADSEPTCVSRGTCPERRAPEDVRVAMDEAITAARDEDAAERDAAFVAGTRKYSAEDVTSYVPGETFTTLLAKWVAKNWRGNCKEEVVGRIPEGHDGEL